MSAREQTLPLPQQTVHVIDCRWLLALYLVIPLSLLVVFTDAWLFEGGMVYQRIPTQPEDWPFWTVIFGLPHIIASLITMADREYLNHYRRSLLWPMLVFAGIASAGYLGPQPVSYNLLFVFLGFYTIYHVLAQQLGLTLMMMGVPPCRSYRLWKWLSIIAGMAIYMNVYGERFLGNIWLGDISLYTLLTYSAALIGAALVVLAIRLTARSRHRIGVWYLWGNVALILSTLLIQEVGYALFVILIPRIIHDVTAYMVYVTHDRNRNGEAPVNGLYQLASFTRLSPVILLPLMSVGIAYLLTSYQHYVLVSILVLTVSFLHYYFEGFIWRGGNPHRRYVTFRR